MRPTLRLLTLLLAWVAFGPPRAALAQTCTPANTTTLDYNTVATGSRKAATDNAGGVAVTTSNFTSPIPANSTNANVFSVGPSTVLAATGNFLIWQQNAVGFDPRTTPNVSTVTYTFSRPVTGLTITVTDIDADNTNNNFIDRVTFDGYATAGTAAPTTLTTANVVVGTNATNQFVGSGSTANATSTPAFKQNAVTGTASSASSRTSDVTVTFPSAVTKLVLTYENIAPFKTAATDRTQTAGIVNLTWCAQADVQTTLATTQTSVQAGASITYTASVKNNDATNAANGVAPRVQLPAGLTAAAFTSLPTGASYDNNSGVVTLPTSDVAAGTTVTYPITFRAPNYVTTITGVASSTASTTDPTAANNDGSAANARVQTTVTLPNNNCAGTLIAGAAAGSGLYGEYFAGYFADALDYFNGKTPGVTRTDGNVNFPATNSWGNLVPPATGSVDNPDKFSARYRGSLTLPAGTYTLYLNSDDASYLWLDAAALAVTPGLSAATISNGGQHGPVTVQATVTLAAGAHNLLIFYGENGLTNSLTFEYSGGPNNVARQLVPNSALCPTQGLADVATTISGPTNAVVGQTVFYQATTTNLGPDAATGIAPTITLAAKPAAGTVTVAGGTYDATTGVVTFTAVNLAANASVINTVSFVAQATPATVTAKAASPTNPYDATPANNDGSAANANVATTVSPTGAAGTPGPCSPNPGRDGSPTLTTNPNAYYPSTTTQTLAAGATSIAVGPATGANTNIAAGDLLLVIQMQGADINSTNTDSYGDGVAGGGANGNLTTNFTAGTYEYVVAGSGVTAAAGGTIQLTSALKNGYVNADATANAGQRRFQVVRVPQYTSLTLGSSLAPTAWNGTTGGIVALDVAGQLNLGGFTINASGAGFRGGAGRTLTGSNAAGLAGTDYRTAANLGVNGQKGEGTAGTPQYVNNNGTLLNTGTDGYPGGSSGRGAPGNAGGGGTDTSPTNNQQNDGGSGGANGGAGGRGGDAWNSNLASGGEPGAAFAVGSSSRLVLGGGGGAGSTNDGTGTPNQGFASSGAAGGGLVIVRTGSVSGLGSILANGAAANNSVANDGSGGGGAGGSILLTATNPAGLSGVTLGAAGGTGGTNTGGGVAHGPGGGGGGGIVLTNGAVATVSAAGGANGTTAGNVAFGSAPGAPGVTNTQISNSIANSSAGASCIADVASTITGPANANAGSPVALSVTFSNNGAQDATNTVRTVTLPAGIPSVSAPGATVTGNVLNGYTITYPTVTLAAGASNTFAITYTAPASGPVVAAASVATSTTEGGLTANNPSSVTTPIGAVADVTTALTGPATVVAGQATGTYTATFTNEGPSVASAVTRQVTLPAGATNVVLPAGATLTGSVIDFGTAVTVASGASSSFSFSFTPAATATGSLAITSNVSVSTTTSQGTNAAPDASTLTATVAPTADVYTTITANASPVQAGTLATAAGAAQFTVVFGNDGPATAAGAVSTVQLPKGLTGVTITVPANVSGTYDATTGVVTYSGTGISSLASKASVTSTIKFDAPVNGPVVATANTATTTNEAGRTANNAASASIPISPAFDLTTTISGPTSAPAGALVTLAVTTTNNGPSAAPNAVQTVSLPQGLSNVYVSNGGVYNPDATAKNITVNGVTYSNVQPGQVVFPTLPSLPGGQTVANSVSFSQPSVAYGPESKVSTTTPGDTNGGNDTAYLNGATARANLTVATPAAGTANAYTTIAASVPSTTVGGTVTLTVVTGNNGPNAATGVTQTVQILPGLTGLTISNGGTYNSATGIVTFPTLASQASGTSVSNTITFAAPASTGNNGQLLAMAAVSTTNTDPVAADNVASVAMTLVQSADLSTTITGPATAQAGQLVTYLARFFNNGPMTAANVTETVQLPAGLTASGVTVTDASTGLTVSGTSYNSTTGLLTLPAIATNPNGATQAYNLTFAAPSQKLTVRSSVGSATLDANANNNSATVTTDVAASADLATTVTGPATAVVGSPVTYAVTTTNNGVSPATQAKTTLQLAAGFTTATLQVGGQTGTLNGTTISFANGASYDTSKGLVTFASVATQAVGATTTNYVTFVMPSPTGGQTTGVASAASDATDPTPGNNTASVATSVAPTTPTTADLTATVATATASVAPGAAIAFTATYGNAGPDPAANVVPTLQLAPGLTVATITVANQAGTLNNGLITFPNGAVYSPQTGLVTFPTIASQASGAANSVSYLVSVTAPANGPVTAVAATTSNTSEPSTAAAQANNVASASVTITPSFDATTSLSGPVSAPVGSSQTYTVTTTNNGPSVTANPTTQTVTLPAGVTASNISNGGTQSGNTITWIIPAGQAAGANGAVANTFTITQPAGGATLTANVTLAGESTPANNSATITTPTPNLAPLAFAVVNTLQGPQSNDAGGLPNGLLISPLAASDPESSFATAKYTVVAAPSATQGTLYYNSTGTTYVAVASGQTLTDAQAQTLRFKAAAGYVGNASFTYLTTDGVGNVSPVVNYTLPIEADAEAIAYTKVAPKTTAYVAGDVIAYTTDANSAVYNAATALVYTADGKLQTGASNGVLSAVAGTFTSSRTDVTSLTDLGISVDNTGRLVVSDPGTLASPKLRAGNYSVSITTTDANGGLTTQTVSFVIPANPLPVVLTAFTAQAVQNRDALLSWTTASEHNSDRFEVERSLDGSTYAKLGQVAAQGTSLTSHAYTFTDAGIGARGQVVYYRLKQVDLDGTVAYSPVRTAGFTKAAAVALSLYPNPATTRTALDLSALSASATYRVLVLDATGRQVLTAVLNGGSATQSLNLTNLATGTYQVLVTGQLADGSALRQVLRLIKE